MEGFVQSYGWIVVFLVIIIVSFVWSLLWQAVIQRVWGSKIVKELSNGRSLYLKTKVGEYRLDSTHKKFSFKLKKDKAWQSVDFGDIKDINIFTTTDTAMLIEFFIGDDWGLWDFAGKYRDLIHSYKIQVLLRDQRDVPILVLKQYEQREMWLGHVSLKVTIYILKMLKMYREGEDVANETLESIAEKFRAVGCDIKVRR